MFSLVHSGPCPSGNRFVLGDAKSGNEYFSTYMSSLLIPIYLNSGIPVILG